MWRLVCKEGCGRNQGLGWQMRWIRATDEECDRNTIHIPTLHLINVNITDYKICSKWSSPTHCLTREDEHRLSSPFQGIAGNYSNPTVMLQKACRCLGLQTDVMCSFSRVQVRHWVCGFVVGAGKLIPGMLLTVSGCDDALVKYCKIWFQCSRIRAAGKAQRRCCENMQILSAHPPFRPASPPCLVTNPLSPMILKKTKRQCSKK